ncbi:MAG: DUF2062 domain-containing protein [Salibacteraceae bacterium]
MTPEESKIELEKLKCCIIVPTYNNENTLNRVIDGSLNYSKNVIVVCDGATDSSIDILKSYGNKIELVSYSPNRGKGYALRTGFKHARKLGFDFAITIDSDGQHYPDDIPNFIEKLKENPNQLIIGSRNMNQEAVPGKSSFGNKFSNFWFKFETGIELPDTQSGFRLYPIAELDKLSFYTTKFEFEIEVIVKAAWKGIDVTSAPIKVLYDPNERVTHFRPLQDFTRISILNTYLVTLTLLYYKPRDFIRKLKKKSLKQIITDNILKSDESIEKKTLSVMLGIFIGCAPFWGFQTALVIGSAIALKLNKPIAFLTSNISMPPMFPFIILGSIKCGEWVMNEKIMFELSNQSVWGMFADHITLYIVGALIFSALFSIIVGLFTYLALLSYRKARS